MTASLSPVPKLQFFTAEGTPLVGGKLYTYITNTNTPLATYTNASEMTENDNPIILGVYGEADVWLGTTNSYRFMLTTSTDVPVWGPIDNITNVQAALDAYKAQLAASSGSSLIGFIQAGDDAVARTVQSKLRDELNFLDFGAVAGGSASTNNTALTAALVYMKESGKAMRVPAGSYALSGEFETDGDFLIYGDGDSSLFTGDFTITVTGSLEEIEDVVSANQGNATITLDDAPSLTVGDVFVLYDPIDYSWNASRANYRAGEWCKCRGTSGDDALLVNPLYDGYNPSTVVAYKLTSPSVNIRNMKFSGINNLGVINISLCNSPIVENVTGYNENNSVIAFDRCYDLSAINCNIYNKGDGGDDYGLVISNCQVFRVLGGNFYARRHGIAIGGSDEIGAVPNRNGRIIGATIQNDLTSGVYSADMHGNIQDCYYQDCTIYNGASWAGQQVGYDNCTIYSALNGVVIYATEVRGGELYAKNCSFYVGADPDDTNRGIIDVGGTGAVLSTWTTEPVKINISNCFLNGVNLSSSTQFVKMATYDCDVTVDVKIDGVDANVDALGIILRTELGSGTAYSNGIIVDNVTTFPSGTVLHSAGSGGAFAAFPQRMMRQSGQVTLTATSGTSTTLQASPTTYRYEYPKVPVGQATVGGSAALYLNGNLSVWANIYRLRAENIQVYIESSTVANWSATTDITVNWTVGIEEI